jgi:hypothetical protein
MRIRSGFLGFLLLIPTIAQSGSLVVSGCGAGVVPRVAEFRNLLGAPSSVALAGSQPSGRREINWDGVAAAATNTNTFPGNFFNSTSTRGLVMTSGGSGLRVSDNNFADVNASYSSQFAPFSGAKTIGIIGGNTIDATFQIAASSTAANVNGFGVIFSDVDTAGSTTLDFFAGASSYGRFNAPVRCDAGGLSFLGVVWNAGEQITRVRITSGSGSIGAAASDVSAGGSDDLVVMDDFIYGEPSPNGRVLVALLSGTEEVPVADTDGTGFARLTFDTTANTLSYSIVVQNIEQATLSHIHTGFNGANGPILVDFNPTFTNGIATGTVAVDNTTLNNILNNAPQFYVNVHNGPFPGGAVRGQVSYQEIDPTRVVFPIVGRALGANNTEYRADVRLVNISGLAHDVLLEYYAAGQTANATPTATATVNLAAGEQELLDNVAKTAFNIDNGTGALRVISSRQIVATARIYNDQRAVGAGTFSQLTLGADESRAFSRGILPMLGNQPAASRIGYRTNIGWFNHQIIGANVTFQAHDNNGTVLATSAPQQIPPSSQLQVSLAQLFPTLAAMDNLYVTFQSDNDSLFVYASVADNVNGDGVYIPAQRR